MGLFWGTGGLILDCVIVRCEVSLPKEDPLRCPDDEIGSSPGSGADLQEEGDRSLFSIVEVRMYDGM